MPMPEEMKGPLVFDTSAVFCFGHQGNLESILSAFGVRFDLVVPEGVAVEVLDETRYEYRAFLAAHFGTRHAVAGSRTSVNDLATISAKLHLGELEVILLTLETGGTAVIDERAAYSVATMRGLRTTGTFGLMRYAIETGWMTDADALLAVARLRVSRFRCPSVDGYTTFAAYLATLGKPKMEQ